jgi:class 3 adenylate cyclase
MEVSADAVFCQSCGVPLGSVADAGSHQPADRAPAWAAPPEPQQQTQGNVEPELRQATIMFCDLAGPTALSTTLDPEDLRDLLRRNQGASCAVIALHDGFVYAY